MSRPKRERKAVNYTEEQEIGISTEKDSDDEFIADKKVRTDSSSSGQDDLPLKSLVKKAAKKMNQNVEKKTTETCVDIKIGSKSSIANICRPNLSEGEESSESDDDDERRSTVQVPGEFSKVVSQPQTVANSSNNEDIQDSVDDEEERLSQSPPASPCGRELTQISENRDTSKPVPMDLEAKVDTLDECIDRDSGLDVDSKVEMRQESIGKDNSQNGTSDNKMALSAKLAVFKQKRAAIMKDKECDVTMVSSGSEDLEVTKVVEVKKKKKRKKEKEKKKSRKKDEMEEGKESTKERCKQAFGEKEEAAQLGVDDEDRKSSQARKRKAPKDLAKAKEESIKGDASSDENVKDGCKEKRKEKSRKESTVAKQTLTQKLSFQRQKLGGAPEAMDESESDDDWEEVDEVKAKAKSKGKEKSRKRASKEEEIMRGEGSVGAIKDVEVSVEVKNIHAKKSKGSKEEKLFTWARQMFHRIQKDTRIQLHKTHLLCLFARAVRQNSCCNNETIAALCLSLIPSMYFERAVLKWDINFLRKFIQWFQMDVPTVPDLTLYLDKASKLMNEFKFERIHVFVTMLRALGFNCRAVFSLQPVLGKLKKAELKDLDEKKSVVASFLNVSVTESESDNKSGSSKSKEKKGKTKNAPVSTNGSVDSSDACNTWTEVYMATLRRWICVELRTESINEPSKCEAGATQPLQYVIGIDNKDKVKDITCRYAEKWLTMNRKLRVDREWWAKTLDPYKPPDDVINSAEDGQLNSELMRKDMPTTVSAFKDHPLYVLQRHLLKFEAIYPEGTVPVGYIGKNTNKEPVYPRDSVYTLHTQQAWMKEGRSLIAGEQPYKMVKGRKKHTERQLDGPDPVQSCYGIWQTEKYVPPPVIDGKITKNEYGNIELFQPWMLPEGAVHIPLEKVNLIARKLDIDYAPAMMGWDHHGGFTHPIFEGIVVAKENEDKVYDAWNRAEEEREMKEMKKRQERVHDNWKRLVKGLMIRAKLSKKYVFEEEAQVEIKGKANPKTKTGPCGIKSKSIARTETADKVMNEEVTEIIDEEDLGARTKASAYWRPLNKQAGVFDPTTA